MHYERKKIESHCIKNPVLLGNDDMPMGNWNPAFQGNTMPLSSRADSS